MTGIFALLFAAALCLAGYGFYRNRKMYRVIDRMLDEVLDGEPVSVSDIREGEISALAGKTKRIQEKMELEIQHARKEKEQVKSLISNMSHQLKTPLAGLMMYRELLEAPDLPQEKRKQFLEKMKQQSEKLDWILKSLFKMVRLEQGAIVFEPGAYSLKETLLGAVNTIYAKAEKKNLQVCAEPFADRSVLQHPKWTGEVFENLLENAVKYTQPGGEIHIRVNSMELYTQIQIQDTGMGIPPQEQTEIFKRFYRGKAAEYLEGSGIGLYLSRLILEKEKGYMTVSSAPGKGSTFSVFLQNCQKEEEKLSSP